MTRRIPAAPNVLATLFPQAMIAPSGRGAPPVQDSWRPEHRTRAPGWAARRRSRSPAGDRPE